MTVVLLHSTGTGPAMWDRITKELTAHGHTPLALPNVGYAPAPPLPHGAVCTVEDQLAHLVPRLPAGPFHLVAHSLGAFLALKLLLATQERPELSDVRARVRSLWMWEPVLFGALSAAVPEDDPYRKADPLAASSWLVTDEARAGTDPWLAPFVGYWNGPGAFDKLPETAKAPMRALGWTMFQEVRATALDTTPFAAYRLDMPTTLAYGARSPAAARAMVEHLREGRETLVVEAHEGLSHMAPLTRPKDVAASIVAHLARAEASLPR